MSFLNCEARERLKNSQLIQAFSLIDWESVKQNMGKLGRSGYGPNGYVPVNLLKALILQAWHSLSDEGLEEALRVRLDFMVITGLEKVPDHTTLCRFRNLLISQNLWEYLLAMINYQLEQKGLKVKESQGAIIDATLIESAARPRKEMEGMAVDREEDKEYAVEEQVTLSKDPDATWLKKGKRSYFGYKGFMVIDQEDGYIDQVHVTPAHVSEVRELEEVVKKRRDKRLYGDKGYASQGNKDLLRSKGIKNGLMEKAKRNKPLTHWQKVFNRMISKIRYRVEQGFGTLKRKFKFTRASYFTTPKVQGQMALKAIAFNLLKATNKVAYG
ncbi:IS5 family transposase [Candidatus Bealeia paramacronuclearis]|uniref:IS5 family transposase n=1 Tax=Candidatus Bealeia paramacronuclearis TaxID=1921001 RepID=A0ABZ2C0D9_9PROT|nr:IS5 family transposase [Candidatus Bealeia paramacronuclearis]MEB3702831.1 IS5 family transposase [Candidatus Bealeia paramacronuclearis]